MFQRSLEKNITHDEEPQLENLKHAQSRIDQHKDIHELKMAS
jgi:hypothetical protein